jgi:two-component system sensor histidine kinase QseC
VGQLLTLSRLSQEQGLNDVNPVDLHKLATEIIAYLVPIALEKNIDIELAPAPPRVMIRGNDTALGILIRNIVDNAIRYTPEKGAVNVSIINEDQKVIFRGDYCPRQWLRISDRQPNRQPTSCATYISYTTQWNWGTI